MRPSAPVFPNPEYSNFAVRSPPMNIRMRGYASSELIESNRVYEPPPPPVEEGKIVFWQGEGMSDYPVGVEDISSEVFLWPVDDASARKALFLLSPDSSKFVAFGLTEAGRMPFVAWGLVVEHYDGFVGRMEREGASVELHTNSTTLPQPLQDYVAKHGSSLGIQPLPPSMMGDSMYPESFERLS